MPERKDFEISEQLEKVIKSEPWPWRGLKKTASKFGSWRLLFMEQDAGASDLGQNQARETKDSCMERLSV